MVMLKTFFYRTLGFFVLPCDKIVFAKLNNQFGIVTFDFDSFDGKAFGALFFCLDFLVRVKLQVYSTPEYKLLLWYQCEDRDFDQQEMVFRAISTTLMQSLE